MELLFVAAAAAILCMLPTGSEQPIHADDDFSSECVDADGRLHYDQ